VRGGGRIKTLFCHPSKLDWQFLLICIHQINRRGLTVKFLVVKTHQWNKYITNQRPNCNGEFVLIILNT